MSDAAMSRLLIARHRVAARKHRLAVISRPEGTLEHAETGSSAPSTPSCCAMLLCHILRLSSTSIRRLTVTCTRERSARCASIQSSPFGDSELTVARRPRAEPSTASGTAPLATISRVRCAIGREGSRRMVRRLCGIGGNQQVRPGEPERNRTLSGGFL
jgi:hypothetical protein